MFDRLVQIGEIRARFLMAGDIIERHEQMYVVTDTPILHSNARRGHIVFVARNETGGYEALSVNADLFVPKYDMLNDHEWAAVVSRFYSAE